MVVVRDKFPAWGRVALGLVLLFAAVFAAAAHAPADIMALIASMTIAAVTIGVVPPTPGSAIVKDPFVSFLILILSVGLTWVVNKNSLGLDLSQTVQAVITGLIAVVNVFVTPPQAKPTVVVAPVKADHVGP